MVTRLSDIRRFLKGTGTRPVNLSEVSRRTGIPKATLYRYKEHPESLPFYRAIDIANVIGMSKDDWYTLRRGV